ncbi:uncharacterized protein MPTK1_2g25240 [Marchantia polymorpha subsp. ruderalis]|uniref:DUF309 domain-containing protein n=1 Tax=Marchantia polymorpha TaxID=3197 RepID=A0A2R6W343_MARPO|nr:hypothetical protein MARPO_0168s0009 [Marchantia polymorpha]BBN03657.1 hypothetical protein Mp_2g25240 [Marchantia polymorpha subsp. ruderalis]|eukprot:PTQ28284.1 hypothetical protein MARPO_0168s0009 [Marchantia polymorpha]
MVTRLGLSESYLVARPQSFITSIVADKIAFTSCPCKQLDLIANFDLCIRRRSNLRGFNCVQKRRSTGSIIAFAWRWNDEEIAEDALGVSFHEGVKLFNAGEYYQCHDVLESLWNDAREPQRSILHGILQCAVGLYHLLHQNHRGAMVELGEGLTKLRRVGFVSGPLHDFEQEASAVLEFIYNTQLEHAACSDDICITMDGSEQSYRLLGNFGAGQVLYKLAEEGDGLHIHFISQRSSTAPGEFAALSPIRVKVPVLQAAEEDLYALS